jgi:RHS repeat-associated protein
VTDAAKNVVERYRYDAYGTRTVTTPGGTILPKSTIGFQKGFTGYALDEETGLYFARARMYSPGLGRFISRDPAGYVDGYSLYSGYFVPNGLDPSGLDDIFVNPEGEQFAGRLPDGAVVWAVSPEGTSGIPMWTLVGTVDPQDATRVRLFGSQDSVSLATLGQMADQFASGTDAAALARIHQAIGSAHALETLAQRIAALDDQQCLESDDDLVAQYRNLRQIGQDEAVRELRQLRNELAMNMVPTGAIAGKMMAVVGMVGGKLGRIVGKFGSDAKLMDHFNRHGGDFGHATAASYQAAADRFMMGNRGTGILEKVRPNGDVVRFNPATNEFGVLTKDGVLRTYYKPDPAVHGWPTNLDYFNGQ